MDGGALPARDDADGRRFEGQAYHLSIGNEQDPGLHSDNGIDWAEMARINKLKMREWDPSALEAQLARQMRLCQGCRSVLVAGKEKVCPLYERCEECQHAPPPCSHEFDKNLDIEKIEAKQRIEVEKSAWRALFLS